MKDFIYCGAIICGFFALLRLIAWLSDAKRFYKKSNND